LTNSFLTYRKITIVLLALAFIGHVTSSQDIVSQSPEKDLSFDYYYSVDDTIHSKIDHIYDTIRSMADKRKFTKEILDLIIVTPSRENGNIAMLSETPYIDYNNKIIRHIEFKQLSVFGPTVEDTSIQAKRFYEKTGNRLHINTSKNILKKNLLFKPGDRLNAYTLADNERLIRALPYIHDVKILVKPTQPPSDSVDIVVLTKDVWSIGFGLELSGINQGRLGIWHRNLFGFGREEQNTIFWDADKTPVLGYEGIYRINNLAGSFINSEFLFMSNHGTQQYLADFQRSFFTPEIKYAGGFRFENKKTTEDIEIIDTTFAGVPYSYSSYDFWIGRSFNLKKDNLAFQKRTNLMFAGRIFSIFYHDRPEVSENYLYDFQDRLQLIGSAGISNQGYYQSRLVHEFGKTEDIPYGYLIQITGGYEINEFKDRPYFDISISNGMYVRKRGGYLYTKLEMGGFFKNRSVEQGTIGLTAKYFTPLFSLNRYKVRYFIDFNYTEGIKRYRGEFVTIQNKEGLIGLTSIMLNGIQKMTLNLEAVTFTPYYFTGFRLVVFAFTDMGLVGPGAKCIFSNSLYSGFGLGIRLRNEKLVFNTIQIRFAFYPLVPENSEWHFIQASGEQEQKMDNFFISDPKLIKY
jgi:hypothetical protein